MHQAHATLIAKILTFLRSLPVLLVPPDAGIERTTKLVPRLIRGGGVHHAEPLSVQPCALGAVGAESTYGVLQHAQEPSIRLEEDAVTDDKRAGAQSRNAAEQAWEVALARGNV